MLVIATCTRLALAQPSLELANPAPHEALTSLAPAFSSDRYWYGWQGLGLDAGALTVMLTASDWTQFVAGLSVYGLGAPVTHLANHNGWEALASLGLRAAGAALAFEVAVSIGCHDDQEQQRMDCSSAFIGGYVTLGLASIIDATVLPYATPHQSPPFDSSPSPPRREHRELHRRGFDVKLEVVPTIAATSDGFYLGAAGRF